MTQEMTFEKMALSKNTLEAVKKKGFKVPSEIQAKIIPLVLENKQDIIGVSQTGSGKTASFALPILSRIRGNSKTPVVIILAPTRELALQVTSEIESFKSNDRVNVLTVYGGAAITTQMNALKRGVDIVVGTPGRVLDLVKRRALNLSLVEFFVLDEADEMLNMGFIEDIEIIFKQTPSKKRVLLFSATMPEPIKKLSKKYMKDQLIVEVKSRIESKLDIDQKYIKVNRDQKFSTICKIMDCEDFFYGIIFCMTKVEVDELTSKFKKANYNADCIHGDIAQAKRERILKKFKEQKINILVATDVAARGIDVNDLTHVINHSLPKSVEIYTHRIGRTGRAGKKGVAISLVTQKQMFMIREIERVTKNKLNQMNVPSDIEVSSKKSGQIKKTISSIINAGYNKEYINLAKELKDEFGATETISSLLSKINAKDKEEDTPEGNEEQSFRRKSSGGNRKRSFRSKGRRR